MLSGCPRSSLGSDIFQQQRDSLPAADAGGCDSVLSARAFEFAGEGDGETHSGRSQRMPDGDGAAIHIQPGMIQTQFPFTRENLRAERFVDFEAVDLLQTASHCVRGRPESPLPDRCP